jgi:hypothetical protein
MKWFKLKILAILVAVVSLFTVCESGDGNETDTSEWIYTNHNSHPPQFVPDTTYTTSLPTNLGVDWTLLDTGRSISYLSDFEKDAIAWFNLARSNPSKFNESVNNDNAIDFTITTTAHGTGIATVEKALVLIAREYASLFDSDWEFDTMQYAYTHNNYSYPPPSGFRGILVDLETVSPKLLVTKAIKLSNDYNSGGFAGISYQGKYGVIITATSVAVAASNEPSYDISGIDSHAIIADYDNNNLDQIINDFLKFRGTKDITAKTDREKIDILNSLVAYMLEYGGNPNDIDASRIIVNRWNSPYKMDYACGGYTNTFAALLRHFGIKARTMAGHACTGSNPDGGNHAWNQVFIDGEWKMFDPTWNDSEGGWSYLNGANGDDYAYRGTRTFQHYVQF